MTEERPVDDTPEPEVGTSEVPTHADDPVQTDENVDELAPDDDGEELDDSSDDEELTEDDPDTAPEVPTP